MSPGSSRSLGKIGPGVPEELDLSKEFRKGVSGRAARQVVGQADPVSVLLQDPDLHLVPIVLQLIHPSPNTSSSW
jgi:hypothetical protein